MEGLLWIHARWKVLVLIDALEPCLGACLEEFDPSDSCSLLAESVVLAQTRDQTYVVEVGIGEAIGWVRAQNRLRRNCLDGHRIRDRTCLPAGMSPPQVPQFMASLAWNRSGYSP